MILDWERRAEKDWQAILWRELIQSAPGLHPPALAAGIPRRSCARLRRRCRNAFRVVWHLNPAAVLRPVFSRNWHRRIEVHFFAMRPTPEWWSDIRSEREEMRARRKAPATAQLDLQFERGNPLLASFGKTRTRIS